MRRVTLKSIDVICSAFSEWYECVMDGLLRDEHGIRCQITDT